MIHGWIPEQEMGGEYQPETLRLIGKAVADCKTREQVFQQDFFSSHFLLKNLFERRFADSLHGRIFSASAVGITRAPSNRRSPFLSLCIKLFVIRRQEKTKLELPLPPKVQCTRPPIQPRLQQCFFLALLPSHIAIPKETL